MADITKLRRQRGHIQGTITTLSNTLDQWEANIETRDLDLLQVTFETMEKAFEKFEDLQDKLEDLDDNETPKRSELIDVHNRAIARYRKAVRQNTPIIPIGNSPFNTTIARHPRSVTLPTLTIPTFDGTSDQWESFHDMFHSVIDQNEDLPSVQKWQYLKASLKGDAAAAIQSLETKGTNYAIALEILKNKFECTRKNLIQHCKILREYPRLTRDSPIAISNLVNVFNQHLRALENAKIEIKSWDLWLLDLILSKVGPQTVWYWELSLEDDNIPSYTELLKFLEKRAKCAIHSSHIEQTEHKITKSRNMQHAFATTHTYNNESTRNESVSEKVKCIYCTQEHIVYQCDKFRALNPEARRRVVNNLKLCFNCLSPNHVAQNCRSSSCRVCNRRHNTLLHVSNNADEATNITDNTPSGDTNI